MFLSQYDLSSNYKDTLPFDFQTDHLLCDKIEISLVRLVEKGQNHDQRKKTFILEKKLLHHRRQFSSLPPLDFIANVLRPNKHSFSPPMPGYTSN